jgi:hypothetical protein
MLWPFFRVTTPDQVRSADVLAYAHGIGSSGRVPSSTTVGARIACLSSFFRFTIDLLHAIYERIVVAGRTIVAARLTPAAYSNGMALALPQVVMARPEGFEPPTL